jgi:serine/threonine-protein kinase
VRLDGRVVDRWTERAIERVPIDDRTLARAGAFARAGHPSLQTVLRIDRDDAAIWLEAPRGGTLDRALTPAERETLRAALEALHAAGVVHGSIDAAHVVVDPARGPTLRFAAEHDAMATVDLDRVALARL